MLCAAGGRYGCERETQRLLASAEVTLAHEAPTQACTPHSNTAHTRLHAACRDTRAGPAAIGAICDAPLRGAHPSAGMATVARLTRTLEDASRLPTRACSLSDTVGEALVKSTDRCSMTEASITRPSVAVLAVASELVPPLVVAASDARARSSVDNCVDITEVMATDAMRLKMRDFEDNAHCDVFHGKSRAQKGSVFALHKLRSIRANG